jgi:nucleoside 2-deoxyribosyltransferase
MDHLAKHNLIYVGTPYSKYPAGLEEAFKESARIAARLLERGLRVYSPIAHTHPIAVYGKIDPLNHDIWLPFDRAIMDKSDAMIVAKMATWDMSKGIAYEIETFEAAGKPVYYLNVETFEVE